MADIDVEELLRQGGRQDDGDVSMDDLVAQGGRVEEATGALRTFGRHLRQGVNPLWDEGAGFFGASIDSGKHLLETGSVVTPSEWLENYRRNRDESRDTDARGAQANPTAATAGKVTGAVLQGVAAGGAGGVGRGLVSAVTSGATQGAANALAGSEADLTRLRAEEYARAATDTLGGSVAGAAGGAVGYGLGKGLAYVGGKARDAYRGARGALEAEARAGLDAEEAALRSADVAEQRARAVDYEAAQKMDRARSREIARSESAQARAQAAQEARSARAEEAAALREAQAAKREAERLERAHGQAMEMNKRADAAASLDAAKKARAAQRVAETQAEQARKAAERMEQAQGQAMEANKRFDARAERAQRGAPAGPSASPSSSNATPPGQYPGRRRFVGDPNADPDTNVLKGYEGGAHRRRVDNAPKVEFARQRLAREDITPAERAEHEAYLAKHGDAVDNPPAFRLRIVEDELVRRGYSPDVVRRAMARFDAEGRAVSRGNAASSSAGAQPPQEPPTSRPSATPEADAIYEQAMRDYPAARNARPLSDATRARIERDVERVNRGAWDERTQIPEPADWLKRGHDPMDVIRQGGGGSAMDGLQEAPTRIGLVRVTPPEGVPSRDNGQALHRFRFLHPETRKEFEVEARASPHDKDTIVVDGIGEVGADFRGSWEANANKFGPRVILQLFRDLREAFPGRSRIGGWRDTGANPERGMNFRAPRPEAQRVPRGDEMLPSAPGDFEAVLRDRNMAEIPAAGRRAAREWETATQTEVPGMPPIPKGYRRLFRGESDAAADVPVDTKGLNAEDLANAEGRWYSDRLGVGRDYADAQVARQGAGNPRVRYVDVPEQAARAFRADGMPEGRFAEEAFREWLPPRDVLEGAKDVPLPHPVPGLGDGPVAPAPFWQRAGYEEDVYLDPEDVGPDEVTGLVRGMGERTQVGARPADTSVRSYDVLGARPSARPGQPYAAYGAPRRSALPPEDVAAAEEAMAARRAAAFGSGPGGPAPEPTAGARPRAMPPEASASMRAPEDGPLPPEVTDTGLDPRFEATFAEGTRATRVPEVLRAPMRPEATTVQPGPEATQVGGPSDFTDATRYAPPDMAQRLAGRPSVDSLVDERIAGGGQALRGAFWRGATGEGSAALGLAGLALGGPSGSLKALALRGGLEVVREALRNPAAKARALEAFKLQRLAAIRPEVWGRVSATLQRAAQRDEEQGTDYHARAARHALLQTDPAFRAAEAEAAKELQGLSEDELARRLAR